MATDANAKIDTSGDEPKKDAPLPPADTPDDKKPTDDKKFTEADLEKAREQAKKDYEKQLKEAEDKAKLSEEERLKADLETLRRENQLLKAEGEMVKALKTAGANEPELLFKSVKDELQFDDTGKLTNQTELVNGLKSSYQSQFGIEKPKESIDGGKGSAEEPKGKPETLGEALKNYYKN